MKKLIYIIVIALILGLVLTGCSLLSNIGQAPDIGQSEVTYLTKGLPSGLVGWWHFDEGSGVTTVADSSGNGNTGNVIGATTGVAGKFDNALSFDGTDDYVQIVNESNFDFERTNTLTLEAWVKTSSNACLNIITKMQNTLPNTGYQLIKHNSSYGNVLYFFLINNFNTGNMIRAYGSTNIADGQWHHVAVTYDGSSDVSGVQIYVDGNPETMDWTHNGLTGSILNDLSLQISGREGSSYAFSGIIDEVRIWNTALSQEELGKVYDFNGFFPPVDNDVSNVVKAGRAIPLKFSLNGDQGLDIFAAAYPKSIPIKCNETDPDVTLDEEDTVTAGESSLNYDADADQYIYVWKTVKDWAGTCRKLVVLLNDGTSHEANFTFK